MAATDPYVDGHPASSSLPTNFGDVAATKRTTDTSAEEPASKRMVTEFDIGAMEEDLEEVHFPPSPL
eukprot:4703582-Karenia_brevis.AAC.1